MDISGPEQIFFADNDKCIGCGKCADDCVAEIIEMRGKRPLVPPEKAAECIGCQHCLAICPVAAASVLGLDPLDSIDTSGFVFPAEKLDILVKQRRSCRSLATKAVDPELIEKLVNLAGYAPTGVNNMARRFTVIKDPFVMDRFKTKAMGLILEKEKQNKLPEQLAWMADAVREWKVGGKDQLFRNAPHLILVSNPDSAPCPEQDCLIALSYFELLANAHGLGTIWAGLPYWIVKLAAPELRQDLGMPEDHGNFYTMLFGYPEIKYRRTVQRQAENIHWVNTIQ